jgi:hypothetical protein
LELFESSLENVRRVQKLYIKVLLIEESNSVFHVQAQMESLDVIRRDYRKNSVAIIRSHAPSDEEEN